MMVFPDAVIALRDFLTRRSDLSQHQPPPPDRSDWYSSVDVYALAEELDVPMPDVIGWTTGNVLPTQRQAEKLAQIGGPPISSWRRLIRDRHLSRANGNGNANATDPSPRQCDCLSHRIQRIVHNYENLPCEARRYAYGGAVRGAISVTCEMRSQSMGPIEASDHHRIFYGQPTGITFEDWVTSGAWS